MNVIDYSYFNKYEERKIPFNEGYIDELGIPVYDSIKFTGKNEFIYHPTVVIQYGLANFNRWKQNNDETTFKVFVCCAHWILSNAEWDAQNRFMVWRIPLKHADLGHSEGWISALTQGQAISLLLRYLPFSKQKESIVKVIKSAIRSFYFELDEGGLTTTYSEGKFLQESGDLRILNGCLTAFAGLVEYLEVFPKDEEAMDLAKSVENAVTKFLPKYDLGYWSLYSLGFRFNISDLHYHKTHIYQLTFLGNYLDNKQFSLYAEKWKSNLENRKNYLLLKFIRFLALNFNRVLKFFGLGKFRFK
jgi:hypothetical protein